ncbi:TATA box-binding protein-like 1 [Halotydeus destructor]|nr:TATA box-binding protein-like 1 [Halotydeus destructor]
MNSFAGNQLQQQLMTGTDNGFSSNISGGDASDLMLVSQDRKPLIKEESLADKDDRLNGPAAEDESPEVDIHITNVVCNFSTRCHLNLRHIANTGSNVIYKREQAMVSMKMRNPKATASIWSSGKITVTGSTSEEAAKKGARRIARVLQKMGFKVRFSSFRIVNVLGIVNLPFGIRLVQFTEHNPRLCSYEPEIHPGATYKWKDVKATFKVFQTGAITVTAPNVASIELAVQHIYPLVHPFAKEKPRDPNLAHMKKLRAEAALLNGTTVTKGSKRSKQSNGSKRKKRKVSCDSAESEDDDFIDDASDNEVLVDNQVEDEEEEAQFTDEDN